MVMPECVVLSLQETHDRFLILIGVSADLCVGL